MTTMPDKHLADTFERIRVILENARKKAARSVNTAQVMAYWLVGREIVEDEQHGARRAGYGEHLLRDLADRLKAEYGSGFSYQNLKFIRQFYQQFPGLLDTAQIGHALRSQSTEPSKGHAARSLSGSLPETEDAPLPETARRGVWRPGMLHSDLSWTHYRTLLRVDTPEARAFYEIEALANAWSARELERQINSLLFERLAKSKDKPGLMQLANQGQTVAKPADIFKDPVVMEFLGMPESPRLVESKLEQALVDNLQAFLLELGKGFAFVSRQERITLDGDHFYIDLVFYHTILKCYVLIDLKVGKLTHGDLGQMQLYVNYYDRERRTEGDNPTLGLILCTDKNDAVVKYTLGPDHRRTIFTSRYKLHLPTEAELRAEMQRELRELQTS